MSHEVRWVVSMVLCRLPLSLLVSSDFACFIDTGGDMLTSSMRWMKTQECLTVITETSV